MRSNQFLTFILLFHSWLLGDGLHHPSLLRHDSVDSGVAKGGQGGLGSGLWGQEGPHHGRHTKRPVGDRDRERPGPHRQRNGTFHPRKGGFLPVEGGHEDKLKFVEEDFVGALSSFSRCSLLEFKTIPKIWFIKLFQIIFKLLATCWVNTMFKLLQTTFVKLRVFLLFSTALTQSIREQWEAGGPASCRRDSCRCLG